MDYARSRREDGALFRWLISLSYIAKFGCGNFSVKTLYRVRLACKYYETNNSAKYLMAQNAAANERDK